MSETKKKLQISTEVFVLKNVIYKSLPSNLSCDYTIILFWVRGSLRICTLSSMPTDIGFSKFFSMNEHLNTSGITF